MDCTDLVRMSEFWSRALDCVRRNPPQRDGIFPLDPSGRAPNLTLRSEGPHEEVRPHLGLYVSGLLGEVVRLSELGTISVRGPEPGHDFGSLANPGGNRLDVIDTHCGPSIRRTGGSVVRDPLADPGAGGGERSPPFPFTWNWFHTRSV